MLEKCTGDGQVVCISCLIEKSFSCEWSSCLYRIRNKKGLLLKVERWGYVSKTVFSKDDDLVNATFCYKHALIVEEAQKHLTTWEKG